METEGLTGGAPGGLGQERGTGTRDSLSSFALKGGTETKQLERDERSRKSNVCFSLWELGE